MLILDKIMLSPGRGVLWILREIYDAAMQEIDSSADAITAELGELHMQLEMGKITEREFEEREEELLDRLDELNGYGDDLERPESEIN